MGLFETALLPFIPAGAYFITKTVIEHDFENDKHLTFVTNHFPKAWDLEGKILLISSLGLFVSIILFVTVLFTMVSRFTTRISGLEKNKPDTPLISLFNRVLKHTLEQGFIFFGLFSYWAFNVSEVKDSNLAARYCVAFVISRINFLLGNILNHFTNFFVFRGLGFLINIILILTLTGRIFGYTQITLF